MGADLHREVGLLEGAGLSREGALAAADPGVGVSGGRAGRRAGLRGGGLCGGPRAVVGRPRRGRAVPQPDRAGVARRRGAAGPGGRRGHRPGPGAGVQGEEPGVRALRVLRSHRRGDARGERVALRRPRQRGGGGPRAAGLAARAGLAGLRGLHPQPHPPGVPRRPGRLRRPADELVRRGERHPPRRSADLHPRHGPGERDDLHLAGGRGRWPCASLARACGRISPPCRGAGRGRRG